MIAGQYIADSTGLHVEIQSITYSNGGGSGPFVHTITMGAGVTLPLAALVAEMLPSPPTTLHTYTEVDFNDGGIYAEISSNALLAQSDFTLIYDRYTPNHEIQIGDFVLSQGGHYLMVTNWVGTWDNSTKTHTHTYTTEANLANPLPALPPAHLYRNNTYTYQDGGLYTYNANDLFFTLTFDEDMVSASNINLQVGDDILDAVGNEQRITNISLGTFGSPVPGKHILTVTLANLITPAGNLTTGNLIVPPFANQTANPMRHSSETWSMDGTYGQGEYSTGANPTTKFHFAYDYNTGYDMTVTPNGRYNFPITVNDGIKNSQGEICDVIAVTYSNSAGTQAAGPYVWTVEIDQTIGGTLPVTEPSPFNIWNFTSNTYDDNSTMTVGASSFTLTYDWPNTTPPLLSPGDYIPDTNGDPILVLGLGTTPVGNAPSQAPSGAGTAWTYDYDTSGTTQPEATSGEGFMTKYTLLDTLWNDHGTYTAAAGAPWNKFTLDFDDEVGVNGLGTNMTLGQWSSAGSTYFKLDNYGSVAASFGLQFANFFDTVYTDNAAGIANQHLVAPYSSSRYS